MELSLVLFIYYYKEFFSSIFDFSITFSSKPNQPRIRDVLRATWIPTPISIISWTYLRNIIL